MKRSLFSYDCPVELIAQEPAQKRDESRLLVFQNSEISDHVFSELPQILNKEFSLKQNNKKLLLIGNNSKVYPARLKVYRKTGAQCEVFVLEVDKRESYSCLIRQKSKLKENDILYLDQNLTTPIFEVIDLENLKIKPLFSETMAEFLQVHGSTPLPPYIKRKNEDAENKQTKDKSRYQNVYANNNNLGSSAAPTAGFHFTPEIINSLPKFNIDIDYVTLHVGLGTFLPVKTENITDHFMHTEHYYLNSPLVKKIFYYLENNWPIVFIGTTSLRSIESFFRKAFNSTVKINFSKECIESALAYANKWHATNLFLYPENETDRRLPLVGNGIITNFHQSESSLLMLVASIMGFENLKKIYGHALKQKYRFFSYGDSSLLVF